MEEAVIALLADRRLGVEPIPLSGEIMDFFNYYCSMILKTTIWEWSQFQ
jgi:hypothetical protein